MKRFLLVLAAAVLPAVSVAACDLPFGSGYRYSTLDVLVADTTGRGIPGVRLTLEAIDYRDLDYGVTDAEGRHRFGWVTGGGRALVVEVPEGYEPAPGERTRIPFPVGPGEALSFAVVLQPASASP